MRPSGGSTIIEVRPSDRLRSHQTTRRAPTPSVDRCAALISALSASVSSSRSTCCSARSSGVAVPWLQIPLRSGVPHGGRGSAAWAQTVAGIATAMSNGATIAETLRNQRLLELCIEILVRPILPSFAAMAEP